MTREDAINYLENSMAIGKDDSSRYHNEVLEFTIKALEQEPKTDILDKIRAEIDEARFIDKNTRICKNANASGLEVAMEIIDKYRK